MLVLSLPLVSAYKPSACCCIVSCVSYFSLSLPLVLKPFAVNQSQVSSAMPIGSFLGQPKDLKVNQSMLIEDLPQAEQPGG